MEKTLNQKVSDTIEAEWANKGCDRFEPSVCPSCEAAVKAGLDVMKTEVLKLADSIDDRSCDENTDVNQAAMFAADEFRRLFK